MTPTPKPKNLEEAIEELKEDEGLGQVTEEDTQAWLYESELNEYLRRIAKATIEAIVPDKKKLLSKEEVTLSLEMRILSGEFANDIRGRWNDCRSEMKKRAGEGVGKP